MKRYAVIAVLILGLAWGLGAQTGTDAYEPNNSSAAAYPLTAGRFNLAFSSANDEDWFSFRLSSPEMIRVSTEGSLDTRLSLYGPNSETEISSDDDSGTDYNAGITANLNDPGTYYIRATPYDEDNTGSYVLVLETIRLDADPLEPNDRRDQAKTVSVSRLPQTLTLSPIGDFDWFKLDLGSFQYRQGEVLSVYTSGDTDTCMELYEGDVLTVEDDDGADDYNSKIIFQPQRGTAYYIKINGYDNAVGQYTLHAETSVEEFDQYEPNNDKTRAARVTVGQTLSGNGLASYDPVDWFTFSISQAGSYSIGTTGGMDTVIVLYDSGDGELDSDDDSGRDNNALIETTLGRGTYYAKVTQYGSGYGEYSFFVRQR
jgi:hypothetical protein